MKVRELIAKLRKLPAGLEIGSAHHDNSEWEIAGSIASIILVEKADIDPRSVPHEDKEIFDALPTKYVVIRGVNTS